MGFFQAFFQRGGHSGTAAVHIGRHLVQSLAVVVVLQLAEGLHRTFQVVVDDSETVAVVLKSFPTGKIQILSVVGQVHAALQDIGTAHGGKTVQVETDDEVGIIGDEGYQLVVNHVFVEFQLVELGKLKIEVVVLVVVKGRGVG